MITEQERGSASIFIDLEDSRVKVYHGTDKVVLFESEVKEGYWDNLFKTIKSKRYLK